eukprot:CAMPEP_0196593818 /NCGR_PEP_ID=MMETSP1081-20130531/76656_1 /TAXON_ID=36882 /ORGANISM="Pyramimonas amylifera, Strain CCMP720" /LENGTH=252 /DNA_ID=CAMNT_0041917913 /DNA_START=40 /DNA_END=798 /DNA_ORIENTATION=+
MTTFDAYDPFTVEESSGPLVNEGRRADGRFPEECRPVFIQLGTVPAASGSAYLEFQDTKVMCSVYGPRQNTRGGAGFSSNGALRCDVKFTPFASPTRRHFAPGQDVEARDAGVMVQRALEGAVLLETFPKAVVEVHVLVMQAAGGEVAAAITCASAALAHANIPMRDLVIGATVAQVENEIVLDPSTSEERKSDGTLSMAFLPSAHEVTQMSSMGAWPHAKVLEAMELCMDGCTQLNEVVRDSLKTHSKSSS